MNVKVVDRLCLPAGRRAQIADLGCGTGATARSLVRMHPGSRVSAVTIVADQIARGLELNARSGAGAGIDFVLRDFTDTWNVAPSVAHVPYVATRFLLAELVKGRGRLSAWRRRHIVASWLSIWLGSCRATLGYYLVSARKAG